MKTRVIGLIGGIAMGKSEVAQCFQDLGVTVIDTDHIARELVRAGSPAFKAISKHFGVQVIASDGQLDRRLLKDRIFKNSAERLWLEALLHPAIRNQVEKEIKQQSGPYCLVSIPLLKSREDYPFLERILLVEAPRSQQMQHLIERDAIDEELASKIIAAQPSSVARLALADDHIINDQDLAHLKAQVLKQHKIYLGKI